MKKTPLIPLLKLEKGGSSFKIRALQCFREAPEELHDIPHSHDHYEMICVTRGKAALRLDLQEYCLHEQMLCCIKPGHVHQMEKASHAEGFVLSFMPAFLRLTDHESDCCCPGNLFQFFSQSQIMSINPEILPDMYMVMMKMVQESGNQYSFRDQLLSRYLKIFLIYLSRQFEQNLDSISQTRETDIVRTFLDMVDSNYKEKKMVNDYACRLLVTPNYLNQVIKRSTGHPAGYHIRQRVVLEAKRMVRYSGAGMKEIAYDLGFSDCSHFSKFFKSFSGMNFSDFRKGDHRFSNAISHM